MAHLRSPILTLFLLLTALKPLVGQQNPDPYVIPVVFHILNTNPQSITDQMIYDALKDLNDAFAHLGPYGVDSTGADTRIRFCLARTAPDGGLTSGINRINTYHENNDMDMEGAIPPDLMVWDRTRYANIWVVNSIQSEIKPSTFSCGSWNRMGVAGYASAGDGLVVSGLSAPLVAHEMGHYLSLLHTFEGMNCLNNDCSKDGDMVCDTPPDHTTSGSPCTSPDNSCNTDTLSGPFTNDVPDNVSNFMDYGNACPTVFTPGQGARMRGFLESFNGGSLIASDRCKLPCGENSVAGFHWDSNPHPVTGDQLKFANTSSGAVNYAWYVNDTLKGSMTELDYLFAIPGKYKITLKAYNSDPMCFSSYTGHVFVNCGVEARFSPDKRIIASEKSIYPDSVFFWNKSYGATAYRWFVSDETGMNQTAVSTSTDLSYIFPKPGKYKIWLEASKGSCVDSSSEYTLQVLDPKQDAAIYLNSVDCYKNDSIRIVFSMYNNGYDTIPAGISVNFYDRLPSLPGATKLNNTFYTKNILLGKCWATYTHIVAANRNKLDSIGLVVDEEQVMDELSRANNVVSGIGFQYKMRLTPGDTTVYTQSQVLLQLSFTPIRYSAITWSATKPINCTNCNGANVLITDTTVIQAKLQSVFGCFDSASTRINVFPLDLSIKTNKSTCYEKDNMIIESEICLGNRYQSLSKTVKISYYDRDSSVAGAKQVGSAFLTSQQVFTNGCMVLTDTVYGKGTQKLYAYINAGKELPETNYANNNTTVAFVPFKSSVSTALVEVMRGEPMQISVISDPALYRSVSWSPANQLSCSNCPTPTITTKTNARLQLVLTDFFGCSDTVHVDIRTSYQKGVVLPNVFTPDGDGKNDHFYVIAAKDVVSVKQMQIFNRWGEKVFEIAGARPNEYSGGWNGYYKGKPAPTGTYVYLVTLLMSDGKTETLKGNITVIR